MTNPLLRIRAAPGLKNAEYMLPGRRWLLVLVTFLIVELLVLGGVFERPELSLYDAWFRLSGVHDPGSQVVILAMDDRSIQKLGPLPWPRRWAFTRSAITGWTGKRAYPEPIAISTRNSLNYPWSNQGTSGASC